jgi:putative Holliday junction resolvase
MRILAIDHGTVRIGLALSDEMELVASPLTTLQNGPHLVSDITRIIREKHVGKVVVGLPIRMSGLKGSATERVEKFAALLGKALHHDVSIEFVDERLSSVTAEKALKRDGHVIDPKEGLVDQLAATVILQDYLNQQRGPESYLLPDDSYDMPWMEEPSHKPKRRHD